ncbi:guanine deaminase [Microlunatus flavus]|uniref:Guanine deaminase n=1 Tax=Microlunatus flavus TaxID=1036181 RepID=A0A1H9K2U4_9ACTN|nr:guanine deaminase [Microlunatus flavus]SEQ93243.1 guanine deaminase [Microlunatus flavus]
MTLYRALVVDVAANPFTTEPSAALRADDDAGLLVRDGRVVERGPYADLRRSHPDEDTVDLRDGVLLPGFVDTHVHYPQVRAIGGLGMPLLDWLRDCALPEEARLADNAYAAVVAEEFLDGLVAAGTTTALVFGSHFADAVDTLFTAAERRGLRITAGQVVSDRILRDELLTTPEVALSEGRKLIERWHGQDRLRYAVTPRFSLSASEPLLDVCAELLDAADGLFLTSHVNENGAEVEEVRALFPERRHYLDTYAHHGLVGPRTVLAHNVHPTDHELDVLADARAWVAHCPTSNAALGSGLFPLRRHLERGVGVALGSDVGAGTGFSLVKEGLQAYFVQQLLGAEGVPLSPVHLLHLTTRAGAEALGLSDRVGDLGVGKEFDAVWLRPAPSSTLAVNLAHAKDASDLLARVFALGTPADVAGVWSAGRRLITASGT